MKARRPKMKCQRCGAEMNQHAEKINYNDALKDPTDVDPSLGGVLEEFHACPRCGNGASRKSL